MQKRTVCKCKIAMSQCHSVSSLDSVPHCWRVSCIGSEVVAPSYFTAPKLSPVFLLLGMYPKIYGVYPKLIPKRGVGQFCPRLLPPSCYNIYSQAVTRVSLRRRSTLQGWWASIYVSMPICVSEGINWCNCYGPPVRSTTMSTRWSQLQSKVVAPELLLSLSSSCCPSGDLQGQPSLSPVCKDASPMSTVIAGPY